MSQEFISACKKLESSKNYHPHVSNEKLFSLVVNKDGSKKHTLKTTAIVIQDFSINPISEDGKILGKLYQIKEVKCRFITDIDTPNWYFFNSGIKSVSEKEKSYHITWNLYESK